MKINPFTTAVLVSSVLLASCGGRSDSENNDHEPSCPTYVDYADPLVRIASVVDASRNEELSQVYLSELRIDGISSNFADVELGPAQPYNIDVSSDGLSAVCTIPCGLFSREGEYSMVFTAPSFEQKRVDFEPAYREYNTEICPTTYSGSYEVKINLFPEGYSISQ